MAGAAPVARRTSAPATARIAVEHLERVVLVVDDQHAQPAERWSAAAPAPSHAAAPVAPRRRRRRATSGSRARNVAPWPSPALSARHGAAVQLDQVADDGQAEAEAAVARGFELSAWRKRSNTWGRNSGAMPWPVSLTAISTLASAWLQAHLDAPAAWA